MAGDVEAVATGDVDKVAGDGFLAGTGLVARGKRGVDAGNGDEVAQESGGGVDFVFAGAAFELPINFSR